MGKKIIFSAKEANRRKGFVSHKSFHETDANIILVREKSIGHPPDPILPCLHERIKNNNIWMRMKQFARFVYKLL